MSGFERLLAGFCAIAGVVLLFVGLAVLLVSGSLSEGRAAYPLIAGLALLIASALLDPGALRAMSRSKQARHGASSVLATALLLGLLVMINILAERSPAYLDLTRFRVNTLSPESLHVLQSLDGDVQVTFWDQASDPGYNDELSLLRSYAAASPKLHFKVDDPSVDRVAAQQQGVPNLSTTLVIDYHGKRRILTAGSQTEQDITSAIAQLQASRTPVVCWVAGEGERDLKDGDGTKGYTVAADEISKDNFQVEDLLLSQSPAIPKSCDIVGLVGPQHALTEGEVQTLDDYLAGGGSLFLAFDAWRDAATTAKVNAVLAPYGQSFSGGLVIPDRGHAIKNEPTATGVFRYGESPITRDLTNLISVYPESTSIESRNPPPGVAVTPLAQAGADAYLVQDARPDYASKKSSDRSGPFTLMETVDLPSSHGRIVLVGTSAFAENLVLQGTFGVNVQVLTGSLGWLAHQENLVEIPAKTGGLPLTLTQDQFLVNVLVTLILLPLAIALLGVIVWARRRLSFIP